MDQYHPASTITSVPTSQTVNAVAARSCSPLSRRVLKTAEPIVHVMKEAMYKRIKSGQEVLDFGQALVSFSPPGRAIEVMQQFGSSDLSLHHLGPVAGLELLRRAIAEYRSEAYAQEITEDNVIVTLGANHAFHQVIEVLADPGEAVMLMSPYFFNHEMTVGLLGNRVITCPMDAHSGFQPNPTTIANKLTPDTKAVVIVNPGNPTGTIVSNEVLLDVESIVHDSGRWLIIDESYIHFDFRSQLEPPPKMTLSKTVLVGSFSKSFSLAGWRIGYIIAPSFLIEELIKTQDSSAICASIPAQRLAIASLEDRKRHFEYIFPQLANRRRLLNEGLCSTGRFEAVSGEGGVFLFAKLRNNKNSWHIAQKLLQETGIVASPGVAWGAEGYLRFSYGMSTEEQIERACLLLSDSQATVSS